MQAPYRDGWVPMWNEFPELESNETSLNILFNATELDMSCYDTLVHARRERPEALVR